MKPINYTRIAMDDIHPEARRIAISWMEGWEEWMKSDIRHKVKLASDIQNFAIAYHQHELAQLQQHGVMQAEGSDGVSGAAVGNSAAGQSGRVGCVHNTLNYIGPWYICKDCGTHFNARAEAPPEGALPF